jgi:hypothetical protein
LFGNTNQFVKISSQDLIGSEEPLVYIRSARHTEEEAQKQIVQIDAMLALETQDPNVHPISVKIIKRERYRLA